MVKITWIPRCALEQCITRPCSSDAWYNICKIYCSHPSIFYFHYLTSCICYGAICLNIVRATCSSSCTANSTFVSSSICGKCFPHFSNVFWGTLQNSGTPENPQTRLPSCSVWFRGVPAWTAGLQCFSILRFRSRFGVKSDPEAA